MSHKNDTCIRTDFMVCSSSLQTVVYYWHKYSFHSINFCEDGELKVVYFLVMNIGCISKIQRVAYVILMNVPE